MSTRGMKLLLVPLWCWGLAACATSGPAQTGVDSDRPSAQAKGQTPTGGEVYHGLIQYRAKDAKPAIFDPELLAADDALLAPGSKVIGVFIGGEARAYPLFILNNHQVVNDQIGDVPLSASW